jgi:hypothetical protein
MCSAAVGCPQLDTGNTVVDTVLILRPHLDFLIAVVFLLWVYKFTIGLNLRSRLVNPTTTVVWWFVPIANLIMHCFVILKLYIRSRPLGSGHDSVGIAVTSLWWVAMLLSPWISGLYMAVAWGWDLIPHRHIHNAVMIEVYSDVAAVLAAILGVAVVFMFVKRLGQQSQREKARAVTAEWSHLVGPRLTRWYSYSLG